ncbi:glutathione hydrolase 1 proenzyme-like [Actinia tenebrosa]|uniref:Glutathione hydrolase 1 proenzyme-like n=1 Tax=Actinia tenebrosa TaxID=6105 RepID=A0A6P8ITA0_ACTTE|nr:glutathione hydrolase 1 proenzyme-like [Actinia tenebrosa]
MGLKRRNIIIIAVVVIVVLIAIALGLGLGLGLAKSKDEKTSDEKPANHEGPYEHAVVASDSGDCSEVGRDFLRKGGSAVDSAVATMFCIGLRNMHSSGIGGGGFMLVYEKGKKQAHVIDFREVAPAAATTNMYVNQSEKAINGALAAGVPGEVKGMYTAWHRFGKLPWKDLIQPAIDLATNGFKIGKPLHEAIKRKAQLIKNDPGLSDILMENGELKSEGDIIKNPELAATLTKIQQDPHSFYNGSLAKDIAKDIKDAGGIITEEDLKNYKAGTSKAAIKNELRDLTWYTVPPPSGGAVVTLILNILKGYNLSPSDRANDSISVLTYHKIVEAFKFAFARRSQLGDPDFENITRLVKNMTSPAYAEALRRLIWNNRTHNFTYYGEETLIGNDGGTSHLSILAANGDAVSVTSSVNYLLGAVYRSNRTGIIYNNGMDDFGIPGQNNIYGLPPTPVNFIKPGKRAQSSMSPVIFTNRQGEVVFVAGASGGPRIISSICLVFMSKMWFNKTLLTSVKEPRLHHQWIPNEINIETVDPYILRQPIQDGLKALGHRIVKKSYAVVQAINREVDGRIYGVSDPRKYSWAAGY